VSEQIQRVSETYNPDAEFDALPSASVSPEPASRRLGLIVGGSLSRGLEVRLEREVSTEELAVGSYVVVRGRAASLFQHDHRRAVGGGQR